MTHAHIGLVSAILVAAIASDHLPDAYRQTVTMIAIAFFVVFVVLEIATQARQRADQVRWLGTTLWAGLSWCMQSVARGWERARRWLFTGRRRYAHWVEITYFSLIEACVIVSILLGMVDLWPHKESMHAFWRTTGALMALIGILGFLRWWIDQHARALTRKRLGWLERRLITRVFSR